MRHTLRTPVVWLLLFIALAGASKDGYSGANTYQCQIAEILFLLDDGALKRPPDPVWIGRRFSIDRNTGALVGPETSLWSFADSKATVLARGNSSNSFVAILTSPSAGGGVHSTNVVVNEYKEGNKKPFLVLSGAQVASGVCE